MRVLDLIRRKKPDPPTDLDQIVANTYFFVSELNLRTKEIERKLADLKEERRRD